MRSRGSLWLFLATLVPVLLLGCGDGAGPPADTDPLHFVSIAAGTGFTCGLTANGDAYCWGSADPIFGLSDPTAPEQCRFGPCSTRPRRLTATQPLTGLSANDRYACALAAGGTPYCWGRILVNSDGSYHFGDVPSPLPNGIALSAISAGLSHICGVALDRQAHCWGDFEGGRRGDPTIGFDTSFATFVPNLVAGGLSFQEVDAGWYGTCGLTLDGEAYCWGSNGLGALGNPAATVQQECGLSRRPCALAPGLIAGGLRFTDLTGGAGHVCGRTAGGELYCWGNNGASQLGGAGPTAEPCPDEPDERCSSAPVKVFSFGNLPFAKVRVGGSSTCALDDAGSASCWGDNSYGQLGNGGGPVQVPNPILGDLRFLDIAVAADHACAITLEGLAYCWGDNDGGQLGTGDRRDSNEPVAVAGPSPPS